MRTKMDAAIKPCKGRSAPPGRGEKSSKEARLKPPYAWSFGLFPDCSVLHHRSGNWLSSQEEGLWQYRRIFFGGEEITVVDAGVFGFGCMVRYVGHHAHL